MVPEKKAIQAHASIHIYEINFLIEENNYPSQHTVLGNYLPPRANGPIMAHWIRWASTPHNLSLGFPTQQDLNQSPRLQRLAR